jgi:hypothetical protein
MDTQGNPASDAINITNQNYTFSLYNNTEVTNTSSFGACDDCDLPVYIQTASSGGANKLYRYNVTLANGAYFEFMISLKNNNNNNKTINKNTNKKSMDYGSIFLLSHKIKKCLLFVL